MNRSDVLSGSASADQSSTIENLSTRVQQNDAVFAGGLWIPEPFVRSRTTPLWSSVSLPSRSRKRTVEKGMQSRLTAAIRENVTESLEVRQVLTDGDPLDLAVDAMDAKIDSGLAMMEAKIRAIFSENATPVVQNFGSQIDKLFDEAFLTPAAEGSGADIDPQVDQDLHVKKNDAHDSVTNADDNLLVTLQPMTKLDGYDWGIPMDFNVEGPYYFWMSDTMIVSVDSLTGDLAVMTQFSKTNPNPVPNVTTDTYEIITNFAITAGVETIGFTATRDQHNADGTYVNSWMAQFSQVGAQPASFDIDRVFKAGPVNFSNHTTVAGGAVIGVQMAASYDTPVLKFGVGYHDDAEKVATGSMVYTINEHLEISGGYKQTDVGKLFQSGLIYRYDDNNWLRSYVGAKEFNDPPIEDLLVAGMELSLKTNDPVTKYFSGTHSRRNADITRVFGIFPLPRGAKGFLQLRSEMQTEQDGLRNELNDWGAGVEGGGGLAW